MNMKRRKKSYSVLMRICFKLIVLLLVIGAMGAFVYTFRLKTITVVGVTRYTQDQIIDKLIQNRFDSNALFLYTKHRFRKEVNIPFIEKIDLELVDNNTIVVHVYEKMVTGCIEFMGEYMYFDKDGIIVESSSYQLEDIPLIIGLQFNKIILYEKLEIHKDELFQVILNLTQLIDSNGLDVDTISFNTKSEVTITSGDIKALLGKRNTYDEVLAELKNILKETSGMKLTIDMRKFQKGTDIIIAKPEKTND